MGKVVCESCGKKFSLKKSNVCPNCGTIVKQIDPVKEWGVYPWYDRYYVPVKSGKWRIVISEEGPKEFHISLTDKNGQEYFLAKKGSIETIMSTLKYAKNLEKSAIGNKEYLSLKKPSMAINTTYIKTWFMLLRNFILRPGKGEVPELMKPLFSSGLDKIDPKIFDSSDQIDTFEKYEAAKIVVDMFEKVMGRFAFIMMFVGLMEFSPSRQLRDKIIPIGPLMEWLEKRNVVIPTHKGFNQLNERHKQYTFIVNLMMLGGHLPLMIKGQYKTIFLRPMPVELMYYWLKGDLFYLAGAHLSGEDDSKIAHLNYFEYLEDISELNAEFVQRYEHLVQV